MPGTYIPSGHRNMLLEMDSLHGRTGPSPTRHGVRTAGAVALSTQKAQESLYATLMKHLNCIWNNMYVKRLEYHWNIIYKNIHSPICMHICRPMDGWFVPKALNKNVGCKKHLPDMYRPMDSWVTHHRTQNGSGRSPVPNASHDCDPSCHVPFPRACASIGSH